MGLDINAYIVKKADRQIELDYQNSNYPLVSTGAMTESEYYGNYPQYKRQNIDVTEFGIRNFWGLQKFLVETLGLSKNTTYWLTAKQVVQTMIAAQEYKIPNVDCSWDRKCTELYEVCKKATELMDYENDLVEFFFCY